MKLQQVWANLEASSLRKCGVVGDNRCRNIHELKVGAVETGIDFGVYAAPESFLVDAQGNVVFKQIGAMTPEVIEQEIIPRLQSGSKVQ